MFTFTVSYPFILRGKHVSLLDHWALQSRARRYKTVFSFYPPINHAPGPQPSKGAEVALSTAAKPVVSLPGLPREQSLAL